MTNFFAWGFCISVALNIVLIPAVCLLVKFIRQTEYPIWMRRVLQDGYKEPQTSEDTMQFLFDHGITLRMMSDPNYGQIHSIWADDPNDPRHSPYVAFVVRDCKTVDNFFNFYLTPIAQALWREIYGEDDQPIVIRASGDVPANPNTGT